MIFVVGYVWYLIILLYYVNPVCTIVTEKNKIKPFTFVFWRYYWRLQKNSDHVACQSVSMSLVESYNTVSEPCEYSLSQWVIVVSTTYTTTRYINVRSITDRKTSLQPKNDKKTRKLKKSKTIEQKNKFKYSRIKAVGDTRNPLWTEFVEKW